MKILKEEFTNGIRLGDLGSILYSYHGDIQSAIVYDLDTNTDLENGCSIDYAVKNYADSIVKRITADGNKLVITI